VCFVGDFRWLLSEGKQRALEVGYDCVMPIARIQAARRLYLVPKKPKPCLLCRYTADTAAAIDNHLKAKHPGFMDEVAKKVLGRLTDHGVSRSRSEASAKPTHPVAVNQRIDNKLHKLLRTS
jgi:hypothetical protein